MAWRTFLLELAPRGMSSRKITVAAVVNNQMQKEHQDKDDAKGDYDGGARWRINLNA